MLTPLEHARSYLSRHLSRHSPSTANMALYLADWQSAICLHPPASGHSWRYSLTGFGLELADAINPGQCSTRIDPDAEHRLKHVTDLINSKNYNYAELEQLVLSTYPCREASIFALGEIADFPKLAAEYEKWKTTYFDESFVEINQ